MKTIVNFVDNGCAKAKPFDCEYEAITFLMENNLKIVHREVLVDLTLITAVTDNENAIDAKDF